MRYLSVPFAAGFELSFFRDFFGRRLRRLGGAGRGGGGGRGGGRRRRPVSVGRVAPVTVAQRPGARRLARGRGGRRRARGRRRRRSGRRGRGRRGRGRGRRSQTQRGRELGLAFVEPGGVFARRYRVGRLFAPGLLQNGVQVYRPFVRRP